MAAENRKTARGFLSTGDLRALADVIAGELEQKFLTINPRCAVASRRRASHEELVETIAEGCLRFFDATGIERV